MAKRSESPVPSQLKSDTLDIVRSVSYTKGEQSVKVVSKFPATLKLVGAISGKQYEWQNAGTIIDVDARDVPDLLTKRVGKTVCCGNSSNSTLFEVV